MSELIESDNPSNRNTVRIGGSTTVRIGGSTTEVSLKLYQDIYHQVTGRNENIRQRYTNNLIIDFSEIEQLHHKIMQLCDVHNIVANNEVITIFHDKERKEQFTSFERFKTYNANTTRPTLNVHLKYNFSIIPAGVQKPQEYVISIRLSSRIALLKHMEGDMPPFVRGRYFNLSARHVAEISVDYVDYVIARSFLESFDEWVSGCRCEPNSKIIENIQKWTYLIPRALKIALALLILKYALDSIPDFFQLSGDPVLSARFIAIFSVSFYIIITITGFAAQFIEMAIDSVSGRSYLKLNKGDKKLIDEAGKNKFTIFVSFCFGALLTIVLGIISSKIAVLV